jgi:hypothetical protein
MRADAKANVVLRALGKAIEAKFDRGAWLELALITDTERQVTRHPRLLRSLEWGDDDYGGRVLEILPVVLGDRDTHARRPDGRPRSAQERFPNLDDVEDFVGLQAWLADYAPALHDELYAGEDAAALDELQAASKELGLSDVDEHAARIRRGLHDDPAQAIGSSKELLEAVLKAVLGLHGTGPETRLDIPKLVKRADIALGLDPAGVRSKDPAAAHRRKMLGSLSTIVNSVAELRNAGFGTGHGVSRGPALDLATARLAVAAAVAVTTFYIEAHAAHERVSEE